MVNGPKPVIVKFASFLDRQIVWNNKHKLPGCTLNVFIKEHFSQEVESNIKSSPAN